MKFITLLMFAVLISACGKQNDDSLRKKTELESETELTVNNQNLRTKAEEMEKDLANRHRFYQAVKGVYEGSIDTRLGSFNIRITLTPSLSPIRTGRVRQLNEIESDLNNLMFHAQVVQWDPSNVDSAVGCRISNIRPNLELGQIAITSESCSNLYQISITERGETSHVLDNLSRSRRLSKQILNGDLTDVDSLTGSIQPSTNASIFSFVATKINE